MSLHPLTMIQLKAKARLRNQATAAMAKLAGYRFDPVAYARDYMGWEPWWGTPGNPGQGEILETYADVLRKLWERREYEEGQKSASELMSWVVGQPIPNRIHIEAGHNVGKTALAGGVIVNHFFDVFAPAIVYTFAPTGRQLKDLLWKEIRTQREGRGLPGKIYDTLRLEVSKEHFATGVATDNRGGQGSERVQGQHQEHMLFVLDEAEAIPSYVWEAVDTMASGGLCVVVMLANPRTRTSHFHRAKSEPDTIPVRISAMSHPNVLENRERIRGAVRRDYIERMIAKHCKVVTEHQDDAQGERITFEVPWRPGVIYLPDDTFLWRVMGIAPVVGADDTIIPLGTFLNAKNREAPEGVHDPSWAAIGVDSARFGSDVGTVWSFHAGVLSMRTTLPQQRSRTYYEAVKAEALRLDTMGVKRLYIRLDGTGGWSSGATDLLVEDLELAGLFDRYQVTEVAFGAHGKALLEPHNYANVVTEIYGNAAETLKRAQIDAPPEVLALLEDDLCDRRIDYRNASGYMVQALEDKKKFKKRHQRSPDHGDGATLALVLPELLPWETAQDVDEDYAGAWA